LEGSVDRPRGAAPVRSASPGRAGHVLELQQLIGNRRVEAMVRGAIVQPKLDVGAAGDPLEQEADRMADHVMRSLDAVTEERAGETRISRAVADEVIGQEGGPVASDTESAIHRHRGQGAALPDAFRSSMESAFGADFGAVRVHTGPAADELNRTMQARAFTVGRDIFFSKGSYQPGTTSGQRLLAHELTHTVQQGAVELDRS
jgi:hypothetical protein